jgi:glyoxylase-like metal-dependent hydrolase (beta-lactamase superfamily II)
MPLTIKWFLAVFTALMMASAAQAEAPLNKEQAPGYHRIMVGDFVVTALSDGTVKLPVDDLLLNTTKQHVHETLAESFLSAPLATSVNSYLINTGDKLVLIDAGAGSLFGPTLGFLIENLRAAGYTPDQVDEIYITHMHPDHVGGLVSEGKIVFPNATVRAHQQDADYWLSEANLEAASDDAKGFFKGAMASVNPYVKAGQFKPFKKNQELVPGISSVAAVGHTPGHSIYKVQSQGQTMMLWGDLIHVAAVQFPEPDIAIQFDVNSETAVKTRAEVFADAQEQGYLVGSSHLSFPGLGRLKGADKGYEFIPVNYDSEL